MESTHFRGAYKGSAVPIVRVHCIAPPLNVWYIGSNGATDLYRGRRPSYGGGLPTCHIMALGCPMIVERLFHVDGNASASWQPSSQVFTTPYSSPSVNRIDTAHHGRSRRDRRGAVRPLIVPWYILTRSYSREDGGENSEGRIGRNPVVFPVP